MVQDLGKKNNILHFSYYDKALLLYEDHRSIITVLAHARRKGLISELITLIYFDFHQDAQQPRAEVRENLSIIADNNWPIDTLTNLVENELSWKDDDWLIAGMDLKLIDNAICIGAQSKTLQEKKNRIIDISGQEHFLFSMDHIWNSIQHQGDLVDEGNDEFRDLWDALCWNPRLKKFDSEIEKPIVLDIDLDCFRVNAFCEKFALPQKILLRKFATVSERYPEISVMKIFEDLKRHVVFFTIARESLHCGGVEEADEILRCLDYLLF